MPMHLKRSLRTAAPLALALALLPALAAAQAAPYHVARHITVGGDGGWDYITVDTARNRIFVTRGDRAVVMDENSGKVLGEIPGLQRAHGVALDYGTGHGFVSSGRDSTVTMFDLGTLKPLGTTTAAVDDDAILYDPASRRVFTFNGDANSASAIDATTGKRITNIPLGGKPEFGVTAGNGKLYANIESTSELVEIDANAMKVTRRWSLAPCESPSGLAIDVQHHRAFSVCHSKLMAVSDLNAGKVVATAPIGAGVDAARFDPATGNAFASNGDGTITVVHEDTPNKYHVVQTIQTMRGARTMGIDLRTHRLYTVSAQFKPLPAGQRRRPDMVPGTFQLMVIDPSH